MTPENRNTPDPNHALTVYIEAGKVLTSKDSKEHENILACMAMLSTYAFMRGQGDTIEKILSKKGEN